MLIQTVDLASVCWASYVGRGGKSMGGDGTYAEFCSLDADTEAKAVLKLCEMFNRILFAHNEVPDVLIVEDIPNNIGKMQANYVRDVYRMQGRIMQVMGEFGYQDRVLFLQPVVWQSAMGVWRKTPIETRLAAGALGYTPPDLLEKHKSMYASYKGTDRQKIRTMLKKIETDFVDAFLIYAWAVQKFMADGVWDDIKGAVRYVR